MCLCDRHEVGLAMRIDGDRMPFAEPGVGPHYAPDRAVGIDHYHLQLWIDPVERTFRGEAHIHITPRPIFTGTAAFDLDEVEVDGVWVGETEADFRLHDGQLLVRGVTGPAKITVRWHGADPKRGLYFTGPTPAEPSRQHMGWTQCQDEDAHFILPCHDHPGVKHPWTVELYGPAGYTLLSNGAVGESATKDGQTWAKFEQKQPMPAYLLTAVCAKLSVVEAQWRDRSVRYLVPEGEEEGIERSMGRTPAMMEEFSLRTGIEFPWPRYDQVVVHDFIFGGMENTGCTTMTRLLLVDEKAALEWDPDGLVAHELAHQWFGDFVTCQDWSQGWLNESWATFMEAVWWEKDKGAAEAIWYRFQQATSYFEEDGGRYRRPIVSYTFREPIDVFDRHLYEKGGCVLFTLRTVLGEDPFWKGVRHYLGRHAHDTVHTRHFQRALEEATGKNLDGFFAEWVHGPGHPDLTVSLAHEDGLVTIAVKQTQKGDGVAEVFSFPLHIEVCLKGGVVQSLDLPIRERERTWVIPVSGDVDSVRVDPGFRILSNLTLQAPREWLKRLLGDECPVLATRAAHALSEDGSELAFHALVHGLHRQPFWAVRAEIAEILGKRGGNDARDALIAAVATEQEPRAKRAIVDALGKFRDAASADALIGVLDGELPTWQLHGAALAALGRTRDPRAIATILPHLQTGGWAQWVAQRALDGLAATEDASVLPTLIDYTRADQSPRLRAAAARAIGKLGTNVESLRDGAVERLNELLVEPGFRPQIAAVAALGALKHEKALGPLGRVHQIAPDGRMRRMAYEAMVHIRQGRTTEAGLGSLKRRVEELAEENHKLRQRIDKLDRRES